MLACPKTVTAEASTPDYILTELTTINLDQLLKKLACLPYQDFGAILARDRRACEILTCTWL